MTQYIRGAQQRSLTWDLSADDFRRLTSLDCHYCGAAPSMARGHSQYKGVYVFNGLDRKDNKVGYTFDNVIPACKVCNHAKAGMSYDEFIAWIVGYTLDNVVPACKTCNHAKVDMSYDEFMAWIARVASFHSFRPDMTPSTVLRPIA